MKPSLFLIARALVAACAPPPSTIDITFAARYSERALACGWQESGPALTDLRLFVHDVRLLDADGQEIAVELDDDGRWQSDGVALVDLENPAFSDPFVTAE